MMKSPEIKIQNIDVEMSMLALNNSFIRLCRCLIQTAFPEKEKIVLIHFSQIT